MDNISMTEYKNDKEQLSVLHNKAKVHYDDINWNIYYNFKVSMKKKYPQSYNEKGKMILVL